ncbi:hypothetical protein ADEAN_000766200 [Angomonas deanei]|uniref:Uncharacterized protein n=1 Tax=Angomonas deanei TaxID=59799 RepID=A0A7G2CM64_9TRYP|nr:hypothetical protein ADEAN_000766200 [Angomonas deanei]
MPPKKKLPRKGKARQGELDLETAAEERIDAVTAEPLGEKFIEVISPDGTLKLFYNTSTLIRIALHKNGFMQPPHFREPMNPSMIKKIEQIEGKAFSFHEDIHRHDGEEDGAAIVHRHVFFDQIMDEFYLLNPAELFVCPVCYAHYVEHYYIPAHAAGGEPVEYIDDGATPVVDPLQVLNHMLRHPLHPQEEAVDVDEEGEETHPDSVLPLIVFRSAAKLKKHLKLHHDVFVTKVSEEYKLKPMLNTYFFAFNQLNEIKFKEGKLRKKSWR